MRQAGARDETFSRLPVLACEMLDRAREGLDTCTIAGSREFAIDGALLRNPSSEQLAALLQSVGSFSPRDAKAIYFLLVQGPVDLSRCQQAFREGKEASDRYFSRDMDRLSPCLYVGASANLERRLKEHLGVGAQKTYALQLSHWAADLGLNLSMGCAVYSRGAQPDAMQTLEDALWNEMQPMFGRRGAR